MEYITANFYLLAEVILTYHWIKLPYLPTNNSFIPSILINEQDMENCHKLGISLRTSACKYWSLKLYTYCCCSKDKMKVEDRREWLYFSYNQANFKLLLQFLGLAVLNQWVNFAQATDNISFKLISLSEVKINILGKCKSHFHFLILDVCHL